MWADTMPGGKFFIGSFPRQIFSADLFLEFKRIWNVMRSVYKNSRSIVLIEFAPLTNSTRVSYRHSQSGGNFRSGFWTGQVLFCRPYFLFSCVFWFSSHIKSSLSVGEPVWLFRVSTKKELIRSAFSGLCFFFMLTIHFLILNSSLIIYLDLSLYCFRIVYNVLLLRFNRLIAFLIVIQASLIC